MGRASEEPPSTETIASAAPRTPMPLSISAGKIWKPLLVAAAVAFAYGGVLARLGRFWWDDENYSHGLLMPFVIGYILWAERDKLANAAGRPRVVLGAAAVVA